MKLGTSAALGLAAAALMLAQNVFAANSAAAKPFSADLSASSLIDSATADRIWKETTPAKVLKLYPVGKYRFVSEIGGGFNDAKTCVVSARAMLLPVVLLPVQGRKLVYAPLKSATAFDAAPNLSQEQCAALAQTKLKQAIESLSAALAAP